MAAQTGKMQFAEPVKLLSCEPASTVPCFRMKLNLVDSTGAPRNVQLPAANELAGAMKVHVGGQELKPFWASAAGDSTQKIRGRAVLVIVDNSGSMLRKLSTGQTRFEAAQQAISVFLDKFEEGADRVAIVPFESHLVQARISSAQFARTRADALSQVRALPMPEEKNNTALYSAAVIGMETLQAALPRMQTTSDPLETMVILLTDGNNDVLKGDDLGLLAGPAGQEEAAQAVRKSGIPVVAIGFSDTGGLDEVALKRISTKYYLASDFDGLQRILAFTRTFLNNRVTAAFASPFADRASLAGQNLPISVDLRLPDGSVVKSEEFVWTAPQMGVPTYAGKCSPDELKAVMVAQPVSAGWTSIIRPVGVFCGLGLLLVVLWFWVPRLIWPEQFIGAMPSLAGSKWASQTRIQNGVIQGRPAPPGFQSGPAGVNMAPRGVGDSTVVNPAAMNDFGSTRLANREMKPPR
ncbi:MAG: VWA domain-containing protein [Bryobacteraceae bacterium]|nr:VWA domain-containing protein [Bryobacteraceae bacterium]